MAGSIDIAESGTFFRWRADASHALIELAEASLRRPAPRVQRSIAL